MKIIILVLGLLMAHAAFAFDVHIFNYSNYQFTIISDAIYPCITTKEPQVILRPYSNTTITATFINNAQCNNSPLIILALRFKLHDEDVGGIYYNFPFINNMPGCIKNPNLGINRWQCSQEMITIPLPFYVIESADKLTYNFYLKPIK